MSKDIERRLAKLDALEAGGVDNWEFYDDSLREWRAANEFEELLDRTIDELNEVIAESNVEQPSVMGAGYSISTDRDALECILRKFHNAVNGI